MALPSPFQLSLRYTAAESNRSHQGACDQSELPLIRVKFVCLLGSFGPFFVRLNCALDVVGNAEVRYTAGTRQGGCSARIPPQKSSCWPIYPHHINSVPR
jgi:hypothetical protein